ncbi:MAG: hypothetical protein ACI85O_002645 [Saprospiraceae bacterium]|jgi:hypothetical protein
MKKYFFLLLSFTIFFQACQDDEAVPTQTNLLNYDGDNFSAPALDAGIYEAAARFNSDDVTEFQGKQLTGIDVYFVSVPASPRVKIYAQGEDGIPGGILYDASMPPAETTTDSWNKHTLSTPVDIPVEGLWIAVRIDHPATFGSVGCDQGSADPNGDLMFVNGDNTWTNLRDFTNGVTDINWNIRGVVGE